MLQIYVENIQHMQTYGFEDSMHDIMSTVKTLTQHRKMHCDENSALMQTAQELSISVMIGFFCESGFLRGDEEELMLIKTRFLGRLKHRKVIREGSNFSIGAVLRHVTSMALCGAMYAALPTLRNICSSDKECANTEATLLRSWVSLQQTIYLGEVVRLSFVLEENLKKRAIVPDESIAEMVRDVVKKVHEAVQQMRRVDAHDTSNKASLPSEVEAFSNTVSKIMVETLVEAIMCIETPGKAKHVYSVFCVNLLDLYGEQYMQWGAAKRTGADARNATKKSHVKKTEAYRIIEKQGLMIKTIRQYGREMVNEQVRKMVTNVTGLMSKMPDMCFCTDEMCLGIAESLPLLCSDTTIEIVSESVRKHEMQSKGIHLLRNITQNSLLSPEPYCSATATSSRSFLMPMTTAFGCYDNRSLLPSIPIATSVCVQGRDDKKLPSNLLYVLKNIKPVLSDFVPPNDPRYDLIQHLRQNIVIAYLDIVYGLWAQTA